MIELNQFDTVQHDSYRFIREGIAKMNPLYQQPLEISVATEVYNIDDDDDDDDNGGGGSGGGGGGGGGGSGTAVVNSADDDGGFTSSIANYGKVTRASDANVYVTTKTRKPATAATPAAVFCTQILKGLAAQTAAAGTCTKLSRSNGRLLTVACTRRPSNSTTPPLAPLRRPPNSTTNRTRRPRQQTAHTLKL